MKKTILFSLMLMVLITTPGYARKYKYEQVPDDPLETRIYTLKNGLKVYLSVNKDKPRVQTYIGVRVGGKNDPAETTGLAHYFEHLMFKGTANFGTQNYAAEKPLLDEIEQLYEVYRNTTDDAKRKVIYTQIDSVSQEASKYAIPNEYDKLMSAIGAQGTNAFTSYDLTAYTENIPANEIENWAMIQAERFSNPVIRLFHTELETVYEEYNMSLTRDGRRVNNALMSGLFPHHPYGTQTILGSQEHLKNPSITNIKKYFDIYYVPNNMAVCMAGDIDPDETIKIIDKYFGAMKSKKVPQLNVEPETSINKPIVKEVTGLEAANLTIGFRLPAANTKDAAILEFVDYMLTNGNAGLIDLNLVQQQKVLNAGSYSQPLADYSLFVMYGTPKSGQSLDDVKDLLLAQLDMLKKGDFDEGLLKAIINNFRLEHYYQQQEANYAAYMLLNSFINNVPWKDQVNRVNFQASLTKQDVIDFCNKYFADNYVIVYKKEGTPDDKKIDKPLITAINTNRNTESDFLKKIKSRPVTPIAPRFLNYSTDLSHVEANNGVEILYTPNNTNPLFVMQYVYELGTNNDKLLGLALNYLNYLGTSTKTVEEYKRELYNLACSFWISTYEDRICVGLSGLSTNFDAALAILEERMADPVANREAYNNFVEDILKRRADNKLNQGANFSALLNYAKWGPQSSFTNIVSEEALRLIDPSQLVQLIKNLRQYEHKVLYYGPLTENAIKDVVEQKHFAPKQFTPYPATLRFAEQSTNKHTVLLAHYDAKQIYMGMLSKGKTFDKNIESLRKMYNAYFGGGMNSIVFQEMREARGLAYSAQATYGAPNWPDRSYYMQTFIATQTDKTEDAVNAFMNILNEMPESENAFEIAKEKLLTDLRTKRTLRDQILWNYLDAQRFNYDKDPDIELFEKLQNFTLKDVKEFQKKYVKNIPYTYCILGDKNALDMDALKKMGEVKEISQEQIFGY